MSPTGDSRPIGCTPLAATARASAQRELPRNRSTPAAALRTWLVMRRANATVELPLLARGPIPPTLRECIAARFRVRTRRGPTGPKGPIRAELRRRRWRFAIGVVHQTDRDRTPGAWHRLSHRSPQLGRRLHR